MEGLLRLLRSCDIFSHGISRIVAWHGVAGGISSSSRAGIDCRCI